MLLIFVQKPCILWLWAYNQKKAYRHSILNSHTKAIFSNNNCICQDQSVYSTSAFITMFILPLINQLFITYVWLPNVIYFPKQIIRSMGDIRSFLINFPQQDHSNSHIFPMAVQELKYLRLDFSLHLLTKVHSLVSTFVNPGFWLQAIKWSYKHTSINNRKKTTAVSHKIQIDISAYISFLTATARHSFPNNLLSLSMEYTILEHYTFGRSAGSPSEQF